MNGLVQASVAAIVLVGSSAAIAADMPAAVPLKAVPVVAYGWTGFYAGLHGGYAWGNGSINLTDNRGIGLGLFPATLAANPSGFLGGVQARYNYQVAQWMFGVESDIAWAGIKRDQSRAIFTGDLPTPPGVINIFNQTITTTGENKLDAFGTFRLRLGVTPIDRLLLYVTGASPTGMPGPA
jgi:outer membrane immunogenic protein